MANEEPMIRLGRRAFLQHGTLLLTAAALFEGCPPKDPKTKYPVCLEGNRACPPEDCGGPWGYASLLEVIANPKHEEHAEMLEWCGPFDPEAFDANKATKEMRKGLPDWRQYR